MSMRGVRSGWSVNSVGRVGVERRLTGGPSSSDKPSQTRGLHPDSEAKNSESVVALRLSQPSRCSQQPLLLLRLSLGDAETVLNFPSTRTQSLDGVGASPVVGDDSQTVASLGVPNPNLSGQAAARQQHPVTGQALDVLQDRRHLNEGLQDDTEGRFGRI